MANPAVRCLQLYVACCLAAVAVVAVFGLRRGLNGRHIRPAAAAAAVPRAFRLPPVMTDLAAAGSAASAARVSAGAPHRQVPHDGSSTAADASAEAGPRPKARSWGGGPAPVVSTAAEDLSSAQDAIVAAANHVSVPASTASEQRFGPTLSQTAAGSPAERVFGPPLPRLFLYGGSEIFEPAAYRRCQGRPWNQTLPRGPVQSPLPRCIQSGRGTPRGAALHGHSSNHLTTL